MSKSIKLAVQATAVRKSKVDDLEDDDLVVTKEGVDYVVEISIGSKTFRVKKEDDQDPGFERGRP